MYNKLVGDIAKYIILYLNKLFSLTSMCNVLWVVLYLLLTRLVRYPNSMAKI